MNHPILDQINALAAEWHALFLSRRVSSSRLESLEERLDATWARYRRSLAVRGKDRFKDIGQRIYYTTPQHK